MTSVKDNKEIKDWPLSKIGDTKFFGYLMAMGTTHAEWGDGEGFVQYADFAYNCGYDRYRLPDSKGLKKKLRAVLRENMNCSYPGDFYGKVHIDLTLDGHVVYCP